MFIPLELIVIGFDPPPYYVFRFESNPSFKQEPVEPVISTSGCDSTGLGLSTVTAWSAATGLLWLHGFNPQNWIVFFSWKDMWNSLHRQCTTSWKCRMINWYACSLGIIPVLCLKINNCLKPPAFSRMFSVHQILGPARWANYDSYEIVDIQDKSNR